MILSEFYLSVKIPTNFGLTVGCFFGGSSFFYLSVLEESHWEKNRTSLVWGARLA